MILQVVHEGSSVNMGILLGTAVNQDGRSGALTAPNGPSQQEVIRQALTFGGVSHKDISHLQMHGTGTPLGDPIELGAATAILIGKQGDNRGSPLHLTSAKSFMGHAEPAAGIVGLSRLSQMLSQQLLDPFVTLRNVNPHVGATIGSLGGNTVSAPRQVMSTPVDTITSVGGVSAFAFQGTNAHALVQSAFDANPLPCSKVNLRLSELERYWVLPTSHPIMTTFGGRMRKKPYIHVEGSIDAPKLGYLMDHQVLGRVLLPGTAMMEASLAAGSTMLEQTEAKSIALGTMSISSPLLIPSNETISKILLRCRIYANEGSLLLESSSGTGFTTHSEGIFVRETLVAQKNRPLPKIIAQNAGLTKFVTGITDVTPIGNLVLPQRNGEYFVPPSLADAALHLGVCAPNCPTKVPISIEVFKGGECNGKNGAHAQTTSRYSVPAKETDVASFVVSGSAGSICSLINLETKVMKPQGKSLRTVAKAEFLYELHEHLVSNPAQDNGAAHISMPPVLEITAMDGAQSRMSLVHHSDPQYRQILSTLEAIQALEPQQMKSLSVEMTGSLDQEISNNGAPLSEAALEGFLRVVSTERSSCEVSVRSSDLNSAIALPNLKSNNGVVKVRGKVEGGPQLLRSTATVPEQGLLQLRSNPRGSLNTLVCERFESKLHSDHVQIAVKSVGINFRDVLNVLGMYPGDPGPPGSDCAGVIMKVGASVTHLKKGMNILGVLFIEMD